MHILIIFDNYKCTAMLDKQLIPKNANAFDTQIFRLNKQQRPL